VCIRCGTRLKNTPSRCSGCEKMAPSVIADRFEQRQCLAVHEDLVVLRAWDRVDRQDVVVRVLLPSAGTVAQSALTIEARLLRRHTGEAGFPSFVCAGKVHTTGAPFTVQGFVHGKPLSVALRKASVPRRIEYLLQALVPVTALHEDGYVHCAVTLDHFLVTPEGEIVLIDFRHAHETDVNSGITGIPGYRAPEQWHETRPVTPATDVFGLGVCLYRLLTQRFPYGKRNSRRLRTPGVIPKKPSEINPRVTSDADDIVLKALARTPRDRFASVTEFQSALRDMFGTATVPDGRDLAFPSRRRQIAKVALAVAAAAPVLLFAAPNIRDFVANQRVVADAVVEAPLIMEPRLPLVIPEVSKGWMQFHTWPPAKVYVDELFVVEAPSPMDFQISSGPHKVELVAKRGNRRVLTIEVRPEQAYMLKCNFDTGLVKVEELVR
jgi:predicted Ser/Thr protein kinase